MRALEVYMGIGIVGWGVLTVAAVRRHIGAMAQRQISTGALAPAGAAAHCVAESSTAGPVEATDIASNMEAVRMRITAASKLHARSEPRLVAVSKTKPLSAVIEAYGCGQRHFGENYVQELVEKAVEGPKDIIWHFIGHLQRNKAKLLVGASEHLVVETVDSVKLADAIEKACESTQRKRPVEVFVQVNTSGEESKSGVSPSECVDVAKHVHELENLRLRGLMTIGRSGQEEDFDALVHCRDEVAKALAVDAKSLELSMGMSSDFETAIAHGSTSVRIGSQIFGAREKKKPVV